MRTIRRLGGTALALALGVSAAGCGLLAPGDWLYSLGVAKIGDTYHVVAPLCDDERLDSIEVYDNLARRNATPDAAKATYWRAEGATTTEARQGTIAVGDGKAFQRVTVKPGSQAPFPVEIMGIQIHLTWPDGKTRTGEGVDLKDVPSYPAGSDPSTVKYWIEDDDSRPMLRTPQENRTTMKRCARETV